MTRDTDRSNEPKSQPTTETTEQPDATEPSDPDTATDPDHDQSRANAPVTAEKRSEVLERDRHRCQMCGREGPTQGGLATLHAHHIERDPADLDEHDLENLTTLCRACHNWFHQQPTREDAPVTLTEADLSDLLPQDIEILRYLAEEGPDTTGNISDALTAEKSLPIVRERLAVLMGLDNIVESRDRQIVDQDVESGEWGLTEQIEKSARGYIPDDTRTLVQRIEEAQVRQALENGCSRDDVMEVFDVSRRTTFHREKRAYAYDFPLDVFRRGGRGGQHSASNASSATPADRETDAGDADDQQRLDFVVNGAEDENQTADSDAAESESADGPSDEIVVADDRAGVREHLQTAIAALQRLNTEL